MYVLTRLGTWDQCQGYMTPGLVVTCVSVLVHTLDMWLLVSRDVLAIRVYGAAVALVLTNLANLAMILAYIRCPAACSKAPLSRRRRKLESHVHNSGLQSLFV